MNQFLKTRKRSALGILPFFCFLVLTIVGRFARGDSIYDNGPPDNGHGSEMTHWIQTDDFVITQESRLKSVKFWDLEIAGFFAGTYFWQIFSNNDDLPGQPLYSGMSTNLTRTDTGVLVSGYHEYLNSFDIIPVELVPGRYWLVLHNGPLSTSENRSFFWEATDSVSGSSSQAKIAPFTGLWSSHIFPGLPSDLAFSITGFTAPPLIRFVHSGGQSELDFASANDCYYRLESKERISDSSWTTVPGMNAIPGSGTTLAALAESGLRTSGFYRIALSYDIPPPTIAGLETSDAGTKITFDTVSGYYYELQYKEDLRDSSWINVSNAGSIAGTGSLVQVIDIDGAVGTKAHRFYRLGIF